MVAPPGKEELECSSLMIPSTTEAEGGGSLSSSAPGAAVTANNPKYVIKSHGG